jgi:dipeptidyl-peptidase 4
MKRSIFLLFATSLTALTVRAQDIRAEIQKSAEQGNELKSLLTREKLEPYWSEDGSGLVYRVNTAKDEHRFFQVNLQSGAKALAFDHELLAKALAQATSKDVPAAALPLGNISLSDGGATVRFWAFGKGWRFESASQKLSPDKVSPPASKLISPEEASKGRYSSGGPTTITIENGTDGEIELFWVSDGQRTSYGKIPAGGNHTQNTYAGHAWILTNHSASPLAGLVASDAPTVARVTERIHPTPKKHSDLSPDGKWRARIEGHNLVIQDSAGGAAIPLSKDGTEADFYSGPFHWSPDSKKLVAWRTKDVKTRQVHIVQSSPTDQLQPKLLTLDYAKPGDEIAQPKPRLFQIASRTQLPVDDALFKNPWDISESAWNPDSSEFSFAYNQRGHQIMRIVAIRGDSGSARTIHEEKSATFIDYSQKFYLHRLPKSREILWASERSGYNHLYLMDEVSGAIKNAITQGEWNVRDVVKVDEEKRQLLIKILGVSGQNPYHTHFARVNFDGTGFTQLTSSDGNHHIDFSPDGGHFIDSWSRVDQPPVSELRRTSDGKLVTELERADDSALLRTGWSRPERFTAKGRDGKTDIHGVIIRPTHFDPNKVYPVVESIYAGPHDQFVPKKYSTWSKLNATAELGFILVQIDGMGTNWRNKAFHDVCWKNLADAGFPDRIAWIKAAAATRPWMDLSRVGIYGGSAGGQNALSGLLNHGDFYKVGVADCGCHDNRMDKIWWNEAWMGWPVDESYVKNSNVTHVDRLTGKLLLIVGEVDRNVDPASTTQVVAALQKADKDFDYLPIINADHGAAETPYGNYRRAEFLVRHLGAKSDR